MGALEEAVQYFEMGYMFPLQALAWFLGFVLAVITIVLLVKVLDFVIDKVKSFIWRR